MVYATFKKLIKEVSMKFRDTIFILCITFTFKTVGSAASSSSSLKPNLKFFALDRPLEVEIYTSHIHDETKVTFLKVTPQKRCNIAIKESLFETDAGVRVNIRLKCPAGDLENLEMGLDPADEIYISSYPFIVDTGYSYAFSPTSARGKQIIDELIEQTNNGIVKKQIPGTAFKPLVACKLGNFYCIKDNSGTLCHHYYVKNKACPPQELLIADTDDAARFKKPIEEPNSSYHIHHIIE